MRRARGTVLAIAKRAGCSRQLAYGLLARGLSEAKICEYVTASKAREQSQDDDTGIPDASIRHKPPRLCDRCGKELPKWKRLFCSKECRHLAQPPRPPRYCDNCGAELPESRRQYCSPDCLREGSLKKAKMFRAQNRPVKYCEECGAEIRSIRPERYCSRLCARRGQTRRKGIIPWGHKGGLFVTTVGADKWPHHNAIVFTSAGIEFVAAQLLTTQRYNEIAGAVGVHPCTFKQMLRRTPELTPYRLRHYEIVREFRHGADERPVKCSRCGGEFTIVRKPGGDFPQRSWCDQCVVEQRTPKILTPEQIEARRKKRRNAYWKNPEKKRQQYQEHYIRNREAEIEKTRRYKAIKRWGLDPEHWKEQWEAIQSFTSDPEWREHLQSIRAAGIREDKELLWIKLAKRTLGKVRKHLNQKV